jgi:hypothetical protein
MSRSARPSPSTSTSTGPPALAGRPATSGDTVAATKLTQKPTPPPHVPANRSSRPSSPSRDRHDHSSHAIVTARSARLPGSKVPWVVLRRKVDRGSSAKSAFRTSASSESVACAIPRLGPTSMRYWSLGLPRGRGHRVNRQKARLRRSSPRCLSTSSPWRPTAPTPSRSGIGCIVVTYSWRAPGATGVRRARHPATRRR